MNFRPKIIKRSFFSKDSFYNGIFDSMSMERRKTPGDTYDFDDTDYEEIDNTSRFEKYYQYPGA